MKQMLIAPSILSADFSDLGAAVKKIETSGADWVHLDVMDGCFVPNITFGPKMVSDLRLKTKLPFDVHLMTIRPGDLVDSFIAAGADWVTVHVEAEIHSHRLVERIRSKGKKAGISIVPSTPVSSILPLLPFVDLVLVMTVNPGFGGQSLIASCLDKVMQLKEIGAARGFSYLVSIDGGVNRDTIRDIQRADPDILVAGSAFFGSSDPSAEVSILRGTRF